MENAIMTMSDYQRMARRSREYLERLDRETMAEIRRIAAEGREGDRP